MKIDTHVLFLILIVGIISAGVVGANVLNSDQSMKQEVFDGIKISVPSDSNFVKTGDGVYKDSKYGVTLHTFKNNDSMIKFLKNTKNSKVVPVENQPPQSVAFKKGDTINILVTNGQEGVAVGSKDGELTTKIANNVVFSDNHKSQKPAPVINIVSPKMDMHKDFNLIMPLIGDVNTNIFNLALVENALVLVVDNHNENLEQSMFNNIEIVSDDSSSDASTGNAEDHSDSNGVIITDDNETSADGQNTTTSSGDDLADEVSTKLLDDSSSSNSAPSSAESSSASSSPASSSSSQPASSSSPSSSVAAPSSSSSSPSSSPSSSSSSSSKLSFDECKNLVDQYLMNLNGMKIDRHEQSGDTYIFYIVDSTHNDMSAGTITVDAKTGQLDDTKFIK